MDVLERELERMSAACGGTLGCAVVCCEHPERQASVLGGDPFPMASTFKVPLAVQLLRRVDAGEISLEQMHDMQPTDYHPGSGDLTPKMNYPGVSLSLR
jgi:beta-lactamase class A|eukprot:COSAG06_NODE_2544_length_6701_cov_3.102545_3_plen_99_part_00